MNNEELHELVLNISETVFGKRFNHLAYFNRRLRTTGGRYLLRSHNIEINPLALELHGINELEGIIRHELCHYHLHIEGKGYKHRDMDFKKLMTQTNAPRFCASLGVAKRRVNKIQYTYGCKICGQLYRRKIRLNTRNYRCGKCSGTLMKVN
ncbi:MAG: SprT family protein [Paenisporosarcina sp.]